MQLQSLVYSFSQQTSLVARYAFCLLISWQLVLIFMMIWCT